MSRRLSISFLNRWPITIPIPMTGMLGASLLAAAAGCSSGPSRVAPPSIDASAAASEAMSLFDKDGDGFIAAAELDAVPGIKAALATIDLDKDGKVTEEEIAQRIETWQATGTGIISLSCQATLDGRPLPGAQIVFDPEPFLGGEIKAADGETSSMGSTIVTIPKDQRPSADTPSGMQLGLYRVRVSKKVNGNETIPAKYNSETTLGQQIAPDDPAIMSQKILFELTSK